MNNEAKIGIKLEGAAQASQDAAKVAAGLDKVAGSTKGAATLADELGRRGSSAKDVYEGLTQTLNGGTGAIFGMAKAWRNLAAAFLANPLGAFVAAFAALGVPLIALVNRFGNVKKSEEEVAAETERTKQSFADAKKTLDDLNQAKLDALQIRLEVIQKRAAAAKTEFDDLQAAADKLDDADMAAALAENKVMPGRTEEEKIAYERSIRKDFSKRKEDRVLMGMATEEAKSREKVTSTAEETNAAAKELAAARSRVDEIVSSRAALNRLVQGLNEELKAALRSAGGDQGAAEKASASYQERMKPLQARQAVAFGPEADERLKSAQEILAARKKEFEKAQPALLSSLESHDALLSKNYRTKAVMELSKLPNYRREYSERFGGVADLRDSPEPVYIPEKRVRDSGSMRQEKRVDRALTDFFGEMDGVSQAAEETGKKTGAEIAREMKALFERNNAALKAQWLSDIKNIGSRQP